MYAPEQAVMFREFYEALQKANNQEEENDILAQLRAYGKEAYELLSSVKKLPHKVISGSRRGREAQRVNSAILGQFAY